jgi:haloalkane dehalogenase
MVAVGLNKEKPVDRSRFGHLYPFTSRYITIGGLKYHYLDEGDGETLVMVHGNPTWSFYFRALINGLSPRFRIIAPDHIGCGLSEKPGIERYDYRLRSRVDDLEKLLLFLEPAGKITLVLHDWGGMIGMAYAVRHPDRVGRIVVLNTAAFLPPRGKRFPIRLRLVRDGKFFSNVAVLGFNLFALAAVYMAPHKKLSDDVKAGLLAPCNCWNNRLATLKFVEDIPLCAADPSYAQAKHVDDNLCKLSTAPLMICWGMRDFVFDDYYLNEWKRRFTNAEIHTLPDAGHYVLEDAPDEVLFFIRRFLDRHPAV